MSTGIEKRLSEIESRLASLESENSSRIAEPVKVPEKPPLKGATYFEEYVAATPQSDARSQSRKIDFSEFNIARVLGWAGATALVFAAAYLVRLAWGGGFLTPVRQITLAALAGTLLIGAGVRFKDADSEYASLLPAGGVVVFFLAVYGAHLYHELIGLQASWVAVVAICILSLGLHRVFSSQLYTFFAVIGSYSAPFLLGDSSGSVSDLIVYFSSWSVLFGVFSVWSKDRRVYLLALYMALVGFDVLRRLSAPEAWLDSVVFQSIQLLIFTSCAAFYSARNNSPMSNEQAVLHAPALLIFYSLEYSLLQQHVPGLAPWIAVLSAAVLLAAYRIANAFMDEASTGSKLLLSAYFGLVLLHAGYLETVPTGLKPWTAMLMVLAAAVYLYKVKDTGLLKWPIGLVVGVLFIGNYLQLVFDVSPEEVPAQNLLLIVFAVQIYGGYYLMRKASLAGTNSLIVISAGHIAFMAAVAHIFDNSIFVSAIWAFFAVSCLLLSINQKDKIMGQSSLLIFAVASLKVFVLDISGEATIIRILSFAALGIALYVGGWLYKKVDQLESVA